MWQSLFKPGKSEAGLNGGDHTIKHDAPSISHMCEWCSAEHSLAYIYSIAIRLSWIMSLFINYYYVLCMKKKNLC